MTYRADICNRQSANSMEQRARASYGYVLRGYLEVRWEVASGEALDITEIALSYTS